MDRKQKTAPPPRLEIVHEDADILVVNKPTGLLSANMPGEDRESIFDQVKDYVKAGRKGRGPARVWIIHRLDKEASGLMVFAKSETAFHWLKEDFKAKRIKRMYVALVEGEIGKERHEGTEALRHEGEGQEGEGGLPSGTIQSFISEDEFGNVKSIKVGDTARNTGADARREGWTKRKPMRPGETPDKPQLAVTHYRVLAVGNGLSLVQLRLETGRKNQIRLHMQEMGHPIVGDRRFGATIDPVHRVALHATDLGFTHAKTGKTARFVSPAPDAFYHAVGAKPARKSPKEAEFEGVVTPEVRERPKQSPAAETSWDHVATWYDQLLEGGRGDHFEQVILPGALRMLKPLAGMKVLDIACGQGMLCRRLAELGIEAVGVDAAPRLIETAKERNKGLPIRFEVADARDLRSLKDAGPFDAAMCVMALMNIDPLEPVLHGAAELLKPGGALIGVILHPAFRAPGQTSWGWGAEEGNRQIGTKGQRHGVGKGEDDSAPVKRQFRRVDGYLSTGQMPITMNPGFAAHGAEKVQTWTFHRPIQTYTRLLAEAGFLIEVFEEWPSQRVSQPGPKAAEENRARREIPMFLGFRAIKRAE